MKIIAQIKLQPTPKQADAFKRTLAIANAACNDISRVAWEQQVFGKYDLQQRVYQRIKTDYGLSAQMVIRCLAKVGDSYKLDRTVQRAYRRPAVLPTMTVFCRFTTVQKVCAHYAARFIG